MIPLYLCLNHYHIIVAFLLQKASFLKILGVQFFSFLNILFKSHTMYAWQKKWTLFIRFQEPVHKPSYYFVHFIWIAYSKHYKNCQLFFHFLLNYPQRMLYIHLSVFLQHFYKFCCLLLFLHRNSNQY